MYSAAKASVPVDRWAYGDTWSLPDYIHVGKEVDSDLHIEIGDGTWRTTLPLCNISDGPTILLFVTTQSLPFICPV